MKKQIEDLLIGRFNVAVNVKVAGPGLNNGIGTMSTLSMSALLLPQSLNINRV